MSTNVSSTTTGNAEVAATYVRQADLQDFVYRYTQLQNQTRQAENVSKDLNEISAANLLLSETLNGFLQTVRHGARNLTESSPGAVLISLEELRMLETEAQLRLIRAEAVQQAQSLDLGSVVVSSVDQNKLQNDIRREVELLNSGSGGGGGGDENASEDQEEKNPMRVDLDKSDGLYTIIDAQQAPGIDQLIGYQAEAERLLNLTKDIRFVGRGLDETATNDATNNRPIAIILYGPPGTGKTTSAQAVAKTLQFTYMYVNAENVASMWAGGTQKNIAKVFRRARIASLQFQRKTLLLIDEIDGLLKNRQSGLQLTGEEYSRITTFLQMLTPPVGVDNSQIVCMFTTNNLRNLDPAFVNRARLSVFLGYTVRPTDRALLLERYLKPYVDTTEWLKMALLCPEFVPRDIVNLSTLARTRVSAKYEQLNGQENTFEQQRIVIPLNDKRYVLDITELYQLTHLMTPATPVTQYFDYDPPSQHVEDWLRFNGDEQLGVRRAVVDAFRNYLTKIRNS